MELKNKILSSTEYLLYVNNFNKNKNQNITEIFNYKLSIDNFENKSLIITLYEINSDYNLIKYQNEFQYDILLSLSPYFRFLNKLHPNSLIKSIFRYYKKLLDNLINKRSIIVININNNNNYIKILRSDDQKIFLIMNIFYSNFKQEEIKFELKKIEQIKEDLNSIEILNILLNKKISYIKKIKDLKSKVNSYSKRIENYKNLLEKCNSYFGQNLSMKMDFMDMNIDTDILTSFEDLDFLKSSISKRLNKEIKNINQIYKASANGDNITAFLKCCKGISNILILISSDVSDENYNEDRKSKRRFGGFTKAKWDDSCVYKSDDKAFLFSLDNFEIYPILEEYKDKAIYCRNDFYAVIFGDDIYLFDEFFSSQLSKAKKHFYNYNDSQFNEDNLLLGQGKEYFTVSEVEAYEIIF